MKSAKNNIIDRINRLRMTALLVDVDAVKA